jgi:ParB family transcriptional regulator, chromosome partitioning protein
LPARPQFPEHKDSKCDQAKVDAFVKQTVAARAKLVQISTAFDQPKDGSTALPRNQSFEIRQGKPQKRE